MFRTIHNPQYGAYKPRAPRKKYQKPVWQKEEPSNPCPEGMILAGAECVPDTEENRKEIKKIWGYSGPRSSYGDGGFWRVAQNSQALGRYNGLRHNRAAGSSVMPYGSLLTTAAYYPKMAFDAYRSLPVAVQVLGGIFAVTAIYGYLDQKGYV